MARFFDFQHKKKEDFDDLPPLVPEGSSAEQIIDEIVEGWCSPIEKEPNDEALRPGVTLNRVALFDVNSNEPIDLGLILRKVEERIEEKGLDPTKLSITLRGCRIDKCYCDDMKISPTFNASACFFGDRTSFVDVCFIRETAFDETIFGDHVFFAGSFFGKEVDFEAARFGKEAFFGGAHFAENAMFLYTKFDEGAGFNGVSFGNGAVLEGATFVRASLTHADLSDANVGWCHFADCEGFYGRDLAKYENVKRADKAIFNHVFRHLRWIHSSWDRVHWALLRSIGTLRLFAASYVAFILITVLALCSRWWNGKVDGWHAWVDDMRAEEGIVLPLWLDLVERIPHITAPPHFGWQLIMLGVLALGATIYVMFCPEAIKEATETRWTRELKQPVMEYRAAMHSRVHMRYLCALCYFVGGVYTLGYIALRGIEAIRYLIG